MMPSAETKLTELLEATGRAHHQAFSDVDGADPDWPLWYAQHNRKRVIELLGVDWSLSELVYHYVDLDRRYRQSQSGQPWRQFYSALLTQAAKESTQR